MTTNDSIKLSSRVDEKNGRRFTNYVIKKTWVYPDGREGISELCINTKQVHELAHMLTRESAYLQAGDPAKNFT